MAFVPVSAVFVPDPQYSGSGFAQALDFVCKRNKKNISGPDRKEKRQKQKRKRIRAGS